jgi:hypothetical protein
MTMKRLATLAALALAIGVGTSQAMACPSAGCATDEPVVTAPQVAAPCTSPNC